MSETRIRITAADETQRAFASVRQGLGRLQGQVRSTSDVLGSLTAGISGIGRLAGPFALLAGVGAAATSIKSTVDVLAELDDAATEAGMSVESMSSLLNTLQPTGVGLREIVDLSTKLTKAMRESGDAGSEQSQAFKLLGISVRDADGNLRGVDTVLGEVATKLAGYADDTNKAALAQALLGRSGAQYLPVLKDLATFTRQAASVTTDQAEAASNLKDKIGELNTSLAMLRQELVAGVLPALSDFATRYAALAKLGRGPVDLLAGAFEDPKDTIAGLERRQAELLRIREQMAKNGEPSFWQRALNPALRTRDDIDRELIDLAGRLEQMRQVQREIDTLQGKPSGAPKPRPSAPLPPGGTEGGGRRKTGSKAPELEDFESRLTQTVSGLLQGADTTKARELEAVLVRLDELFRAGLDPSLYGDAVSRVFEDMAKAGVDTERIVDGLSERMSDGRLSAQAFDAAMKELFKTPPDNAAKSLTALDRAFFDGRINVQAYDAAVRALFRTTATAGEDGAASLRDLAERWRDAIDPLREYARQLQEVNRAERDGALAPDEAERARARIQSDATKAVLPTDAIARTDDAARELGMTFSSAFEDAVVEGENLREVLGALEQDILRIVTRKMATEPLANALSSVLGNMVSGMFGSGAPISVSVPSTVLNAKGNVVTKDGPMPLRWHARGGIAHGPMVSVFGEGSMPEAYVPLPDGRSIPVTVTGRGGDTIINVTTPDAESFRRSEGQIKSRVAAWSSGAGRWQ